jgi:hypothetical protein
MVLRSVVMGAIVVGVSVSWVLVDAADGDVCLRLIGSTTVGSDVRGVAMTGDTVVVADEERDLRVFTIDPVGGIREVAGLHTPGHAVDVDADGSLAVVVEYDFGCHVVDISEPESPRLLGSVPTSCAAQSVALDGQLAYVACFRDGLTVIDLEDPTQPTRIGDLDTPGMAYGVAAEGGRVYLADFMGGLRIVDVSRPHKPREIGAVTGLTWATDVSVDGRWAYVTDGRKGLSVIDVVNPKKPVEVTVIADDGTATDLRSHVEVAGNQLLVVNDRLWMADLSEPDRPRYTDQHPIGGGAVGLAADGSRSVVAQAGGDLAVFERVECSPTAPANAGESVVGQLVATAPPEREKTEGLE